MLLALIFFCNELNKPHSVAWRCCLLVPLFTSSLYKLATHSAAVDWFLEMIPELEMYQYVL